MYASCVARRSTPNTRLPWDALQGPAGPLIKAQGGRLAPTGMVDKARHAACLGRIDQKIGLVERKYVKVLVLSLVPCLETVVVHAPDEYTCSTAHSQPLAP